MARHPVVGGGAHDLSANFGDDDQVADVVDITKWKQSVRLVAFLKAKLTERYFKAHIRSPWA